MSRRIPFRLILALVYLCLLFGTAGVIYRLFLSFHGEVFLVPGSAVNLAVRPRHQEGSLSLFHQNLPPEVLFPGVDRRIQKYYGKDITVDSQPLGFGVRLDGIEVVERFPPLEELEIDGPEGTVTIPAEPGQSLPLEDCPGRIAGSEPWQGLVRYPGGGLPMASLRIEGGDEAPGAFLLARDKWVYPSASWASVLHWFSSREAAEAALPDALDALGTRWGVTDGESTHWLTSFIPGTGMGLQDGSEVTLLAYRPPGGGSRSSMTVEVRRASGVERITVEANQHSTSGLLHYESPGEAHWAVLVHGWRAMGALVACYEDGRCTGRQFIEEGGRWAPAPEIPWTLCLEQVMAQAAPTDPEKDDVWQLRLEMADGTLGLRQGNTVQHGAYRFTYHRTEVSPRTEYRLTALLKTPVSFQLKPGQSRRIESWRFTRPQEDPASSVGPLLQVRRVLGGPAQIAGLAVFVLASFVLAFVRLNRKAG